MLFINADNPESGPDTLTDQCCKCIALNLSIISQETEQGYELYDGITLPREICEKLLQAYQRSRNVLDDRFLRIFSNPGQTNLKRVCLRDSNINDDGLKRLLSHNLEELELTKCPHITPKSIDAINFNNECFTSLVIGTKVSLLPYKLPTDRLSTYEIRKQIYPLMLYPVLTLPNLRRLTLYNFRVEEDRFLNYVLDQFPKLMYLDLSFSGPLGNLRCLENKSNLVSLILHNGQNILEVLPSICSLKNLRHLDISQTHDKTGVFVHHNYILKSIVESLPNLTSLDISGTNLAGTGVAEQKENEHHRTDIPGLSSRVDKPFEFLGLYGTHHGACRRHDIPAKVISGDANEAQILTAAAAYVGRPDVLQRVLNDLYHLLRYESCQDINRSLMIVLEAMNRHVSKKHIQISGSASLFYIVKIKDKPTLPLSTKRRIITTLLNGMNCHKHDDTMMRNGCLTLCQFKIPHDVLFEYERLVPMLLHIVSDMEQEGFVQRIGIYLLNSLACQVDGTQKKLLGELGAIDKMLALINDRLRRARCDDVLEVAWSTMWNVTDETAENCEKFLEQKGLEYFLSCLKLFPNKDELMRNMMGLLGNVAEVKELRPRLMTSRYIAVFADLVDSSSDGIEVSYNAAGVLSHIASDGEEAWSIKEPKRCAVLLRMVQAIERWSLRCDRNINYRSFEPILQLARVRHTPECQHWAIWALANLTHVYPDKYCRLVDAEGGIEILQNVIADDAPYDRIKELAAMVISHCQQYRESVDLQLDG